MTDNKKHEHDQVIFQILDWDYFHDENDEGKKTFCVRLFGKDKNQKTVYLQVNNFKPYFYIEINKNWRLSTVDKILDEVKKRVKKDCVDGLKSYKIEEKYKFWGFTNYKLFHFAKFTFDDFDSMKAYASAFTRQYKIYAIDRKKFIKFKLYESNILPILRFMHIRQLEAVGWISIPNNKIEQFEYPPTCCTLNYKTDWTNISKVDDRLIEKFIIASFDIECTSEDGSFPQPTRDGDKVIQIGITLSRYGEDECYYKHLLSLKNTADIEGVTVEWFKTEEDLLLGFTKFLRKHDPDIITGYNIFGFDFNYLRQRSKKLGIENKFSRLSRINNEMSEWIESDLSSAALGKNILTYFKMTGRVIIDLMKVVQRDYKLSSYKLDSVASYFIREGITNIEKDEENDQFKVLTKNTSGVIKGDFVTISYMEGVVETKYNEGQKFKILDIGKDYLVLTGTIDTEEFMNKGFKVFWCQAKDDISPNDIFRMADGSPEDRSIIGKYCIMDCALCNKLIAKLQVITNNVSMANVCNVPLSYLFLRGQGVKIYSLVAKKCREKNHLVPVIKKKIKKEDLKKSDDPKLQEKIKREAKFENFVNELNTRQHEDINEDDEDDVGYEGAIVFIPKPGVYYEPIPVLDYNSLYPNAMILRNLSHETYVDDPEYDNLPGYRYHEITYNNNDGTMTTCRFAEKLDGTKGIVPEILMDLLAARKNTRKLMEFAKNHFEKSILDSRQLAYKITANSLYGQTGGATSPICMKWIAASTTATGREMLIFSKHFIENMLSEMINLALANEKKYYKKMKEFYTYYPTTFEVGIRGIDEKTNEVTNILHNIHVYTGDNVELPESKFVRGSIGYELECELYNDSKNISPFYDAYVDTFKKAGFSSVNEFNEKFVKIIKNSSIANREDFCNDLTNLIVKEKGSRTKVYTNNKKMIKSMGFNEDSFKDDFCDSLKALKPDKKKEFFEILHDNIENMGYNNKNELFEKFYNVVNRTLHECTSAPEAIYGDTDSVFFKMNIKDSKTGAVLKDKEALKKCIKFGIWASILIGGLLPHPMNMEYEKVLWPFIIQGKKRYVGNLYEKNINKFSQKGMGLETKRRDNAPIVKIACSGIIDQLLNKHDSHGAYEFTKKLLQKIITGKIKKDKFVITKTLKGNALTKAERLIESVKPKDQRSYADRTRIVHAVLADRMADRDAGNKPLSNDRIPYMYIETKTEPKLQGDKVETPEFIEANNLKIDYLFYITNQVMNPSLKFLDLIIENASDIFREYIIKEENRKRCMMPITYYADGKDDSDNEFDEIEEFIDGTTSKNPMKEQKKRIKKETTKTKKKTSLNSMFNTFEELLVDNDKPNKHKDDKKPKKKKPSSKKKGGSDSSKSTKNKNVYISMNDLLD